MRLAIISIFAVGAGPFLAYEGYQSKQLLDKLDKEGVEVKGIPTEGHTSGSRKSRSYLINVAYPVKNAKAETKEFKVTRSYYDSIGKDGKFTVETVPVKYLPSDPTTAIIVGGSSDDSAMLYGGPIMAAAGLAYLLYLRKQRNAAAA